MVDLEAKIRFMLSKFRDLIMKAAIEIVKRRHQDKCSLGDSIELNAKIIEKESKLEISNKQLNNERISYKKAVSQNFNDLYSSSIAKTEVQVSCCCGQKFVLTNKDKEFQNELNKVQKITEKPNYEVRQQSVQEYRADKSYK